MMRTELRCQQDEIYAAARETDRGRAFANLEEIAKYVRDLREQLWWERFYWPVLNVEVGPARSEERSVGWYDKKKGAGRIEIARSGLYERTVLHELGHVVAMALHDSHAHDPWFAREFANLVFLARGNEAWQELTLAFQRHGVDYSGGVA